MQIIVIDPVPTTSQLLQYVLTEAGHDVIVVQRGADALRAVEEHEPAAILLESRLPDMDGTTLCKELRARQYVGPVIFVSAENVVGAKVEAFTHGADDFIVRPYDPAELIARVAAVVRLVARPPSRRKGPSCALGMSLCRSVISPCGWATGRRCS